MPRGVRHYRTTTTYRGNGVSIRSVESKRGGGRYWTPKEQADFAWVIGGLLIILLLIAWPFFITSIPLWARWAIALPWYVLLIAFFVWANHEAKRKRARTAAAAAGVTSTPASAPVVAPPPAAIATPSTTAPTPTPDQLARSQEAQARAIREERARVTPTTASTANAPTTGNAAPTESTVDPEISEMAKRVNARADVLSEKLAVLRREASRQRGQENKDDPAERLKKLADLHQSGLLTDEEFAAKRAAIVDLL